MMQQVTGAASVLVVTLAYVLLVEAMTAAIVLLSEFIVLRVRGLWSLVPPKPPQSRPGDDGAEYKIGGSLIRW